MIPSYLIDVLFAAGTFRVRFFRVVAGALGVCLGLRRVFVALRVLVLAVVFGRHAMGFGRILVMLRGFGVRLIWHVWTFYRPENADY